MSNGQNIHFVDEIKQEYENENYEIDNNIEPDYQFKLEPEVEWNEQNFNFEKYSISTELPIHLFHSIVLIEKLPDSTLEKYIPVHQKPVVAKGRNIKRIVKPKKCVCVQQKTAATKGRNTKRIGKRKKCVSVQQKTVVTKGRKIKRIGKLEKCVSVQQKTVVTEGRKIKRIGKRKFLGTYQKFCPKCDKRISHEEKRAPKICSECSIRLKFECRKCKKQLNDYASIKIHVIKHCNSTGEHHQCLKCKYVSVSKSDVELHVKRYHRSWDVTESMERRENSYKKQRGRNVETHECSLCRQPFRTLGEVLWHIQSCGEDQKDLREKIEQMCTYRCLDCNYTIAKFESSEHRTRKDCDKCGLTLSRACNVCEKVFSSGHGFYLHFKSIHGKTHRGPFACPLCVFSVSTIDSLAMHYKNSHQTNAPRCKRCGKHNATISSLKAHESRCGVASKIYCCAHCSFKTIFRSCMVTHLRNVHSIENSIDCSNCGRKYKNHRSYNDHFRYCGVEPYLQCGKCTYKTSYKSALVRHTYVMHPEEGITKGFKCTLCGKVFQNDSHRKSHEYTHRKKRLSCNDCFFTSLRWSDLTRHMSTMHLSKKGPNTEECRDCGAILKRKYNLKLHSRYCPTKPHFQCAHCIYKTQKKLELRAHLKWLHSKIYCSEIVSNLDNQIDVAD